ncbi:pyridoxamine 5'-phosphate oxidase family protein [Amycolatopsis cynarae]|uniref:Pyridoxamine 5'-phosphate oxidase family protein n=1 Tax=Amycolatopsis cynarae TaxID=2995223 RepID=A0ABY7B829_9PSEU|nr:pyridoxamine 5'-phosphate oxidase family protein [Amycolatopsis sp. HUAS 11-8]WAL66908.1 pyridoxamine 5'-phosphate oxidase family protein [Amycolatopsis sp. HUAS 11-8]
MPSSEIKILGVRECLALLRSVPVGRVVFTEGALPAIRPVNFAVIDGVVVIRGARGSWADKLHNTVVAFEADEIDIATHTGWNVVVIGKAQLVTDIDEMVELIQPMSRPWATGHRDRLLKVEMEQISGRRLVPAHAAVLHQVTPS